MLLACTIALWPCALLNVLYQNIDLLVALFAVCCADDRERQYLATGGNTMYFFRLDSTRVIDATKQVLLCFLLSLHS